MQVRDHPVIGDLVHCRALLEKMRPLDARMQHSVARLLRAAASAPAVGGAAGGKRSEKGRQHEQDDEDDADEGGEVQIDESAARPMPGALLKHGDRAAASSKQHGAGGKRQPRVEDDRDDDDEEEGAEEDGEGSGGAYQPLRRAAVMYDGDGAQAARTAREASRRAARLSRSTLLSELKAAYGDAPEEAGAAGTGEAAASSGRGAGVDEALARAASERETYEEDMFVRVAGERPGRREGAYRDVRGATTP
jgi:hypothetical protein